MKQRAFIAAGLAALLLTGVAVSVTAHPQDAQGQPPAGGMRRGPGGPGPGGFGMPGLRQLDLTDARMQGDTATVEVFAFWGGIEIFVPPDWTVTSRVTTLMGGFIDKRRPTSVVPTKTLIVSGMIVMSGIEVKN